jgi:ribonuclease P/MRP protein subunit RPP1
MRKYIDTSVHAFPEGSDTAQRLRDVARRLGFFDIVITVHSPHWSSDPDSNFTLGVEIVSHTVRDLRKQIAFFREKTIILGVHGGDRRINRAACKDDRVDILMHPEKGTHSTMGQVEAKLAKKNQVALGLGLSYFWKTEKLQRSRLLTLQRKNLAVCKKLGVPVVVTSNACSRFDMRAPNQLKALAQILGLSDLEADIALSKNPLNILERREEEKKGSS